MQISPTKTEKMQISFENLTFDIPKILQKNTILAQCDTICVFKKTPKTLENGKTVEKLGPVFNTRPGPVFNTRNPKSWTSF